MRHSIRNLKNIKQNTASENKKRLGKPSRFLFLSCVLAVKKTPDVTVKHHKYKVDSPNDIPTKNKSENSGNVLAFLESCKCTANPRCERNDSQNKADQSVKTKYSLLFAIINLLCLYCLFT